MEPKVFNLKSFNIIMNKKGIPKELLKKLSWKFGDNFQPKIWGSKLIIKRG
jgi:hypothetical protein